MDNTQILLKQTYGDEYSPNYNEWLRKEREHTKGQDMDNTQSFLIESPKISIFCLSPGGVRKLPYIQRDDASLNLDEKNRVGDIRGMEIKGASYDNVAIVVQEKRQGIDTEPFYILSITTVELMLKIAHDNAALYGIDTEWDKSDTEYSKDRIESRVKTLLERKGST